MPESWRERYKKVLPKLEKKRLILPSEKDLRDRLNAVRERFSAFSEQYPEAVGIALAGSYTKGYATAESDLDGILFIDPSKKVGSTFDDLNDPKRLRDAFQELMSKKLSGLEYSFIPNVLGEKEISNIISFIKENYERVARGSYARIELAVPNFEENCMRLGNLFYGIAVGRTLDPYRKFLLEKLMEMGALGERIWRGIMFSVQLHERPTARPGFEDKGLFAGTYSRLYPRTLEEAWKQYVEHQPFRKI